MEAWGCPRRSSGSTSWAVCFIPVLTLTTKTVLSWHGWREDKAYGLRISPQREAKAASILSVANCSKLSVSFALKNFMVRADWIMLDEEERSAWGRGRAQTPSDDVFATFYIYATERLAEAGYIHYEISNWARPGFECKHNLKYWNGAPYRGFGVSAHSFSKPRRFWNTVSLAQYADLIDEGRLPIVGQEILTRGMQLEEAFLIGLRRTCGFDVWKIAEELAVTYPTRWFDTVGDLEDAGVIQFDGRFLKLTPAGWLVANGVTEELLWPNLLSTSEATL